MRATDRSKPQPIKPTQTLASSSSSGAGSPFDPTAASIEQRTHARQLLLGWSFHRSIMSSYLSSLLSAFGGRGGAGGNDHGGEDSFNDFEDAGSEENTPLNTIAGSGKAAAGAASKAGAKSQDPSVHWLSVQTTETDAKVVVEKAAGAYGGSDWIGRWRRVSLSFVWFGMRRRTRWRLTHECMHDGPNE